MRDANFELFMFVDHRSKKRILVSRSHMDEQVGIFFDFKLNLFTKVCLIFENREFRANEALG